MLTAVLVCLLEGSLLGCCSLLLPNEDTHAIRLTGRGAWATFPRTMIYELHLSTVQATVNARHEHMSAMLYLTSLELGSCDYKSLALSSEEQDLSGLGFEHLSLQRAFNSS